MAHFAQVDGNNVVRNVIVVDNSDLGAQDFPYSERPAYCSFIPSA